MKALAKILTGVLVLAACSPAPESATETTDTAQETTRIVNVYSSRHYASDRAIYAAFTEETGIEVNLIEAGGDQLIERVRADGERSPADVLITVDAARLYRADEAGLFAPTDFSGMLPDIADHLIHPEGHWVSLAKRARVIAYSVDRVDPSEISNYEDLAGPEWEGRICIRSSGNVYNQSLMAGLIARSGEEAAEAWAQAINNNMARAPQGGDTDQIRGIAAGECDVAIVNNYYYGSLARSDDPANNAVAEAVGLIFPNQDMGGTHINVSGAGIAVNAPHPEEARELIAFFLGDFGQRAFAEMTNEYPVVETTQWDNPVLEASLPFVEDTRNVNELGENNAVAQRVFDRVGWQ
ncbi:MAG: extracellular solute-binding protein [Alphaproteobacteria bacterium]|nr:extracellular solute-binding protein [Alphaproteobacteria bacterium]